MEHKVRWGLAHIRGQAKTWLSSSGLQLQDISWVEPCQVLIDRFPDNQAVDPMDQLQHLKQVREGDHIYHRFSLWTDSLVVSRTTSSTLYYVRNLIPCCLPTGTPVSMRNLTCLQQEGRFHCPLPQQKLLLEEKFATENQMGDQGNPENAGIVLTSG